jgi:hypothetical protein
MLCESSALKSDSMDFGGDYGLWLDNIAESMEGKARRMAFLEAFAIKSDQAVIDLGNGGGIGRRQHHTELFAAG